MQRYVDLAGRTTSEVVAAPGRHPASYADLNTAFSAVEEQLPSVSDAIEADAAAESQKVHTAQSRAIRTVLLAGGLGLVVLVGICVLVARDDYQATIASAVEEQSGTTSEIGRTVSDAAGRSQSIAVGGNRPRAAQDPGHGGDRHAGVLGDLEDRHAAARSAGAEPAGRGGRRRRFLTGSVFVRTHVQALAYPGADRRTPLAVRRTVLAGGTTVLTCRLTVGR